MSFFSKLWNIIRNPIRYVGRDLEGNRFYEGKSPNDPSRTKRTVQYLDMENSWRYIGGGKQLPIQWSAWLTHTRRQPPTLEELEGDYARRQRLRDNVARIEARDRAEADEMLRIRQQDAQRALEAAARGQRRLQEPTADASPPQEPSVNRSTPAELPIQEEQTTRTTTDLKTRVRPPTFLTAASPRKSESSKPFSLPSLESLDDVQPTQAKASDQDLQSAGLPAMPSRLPSETESWTPKARKRG